MTLRLAVDLDGVVADFRSAFREVAGQVLDRDLAGEAESLSPSELDRVWKAIGRTPNWWVTVRPYEPEQIGRLYARAREGRWEVVFLTKRPSSAGDSVQLQTQWWLEQFGYFLPAVVTVPGSRGELANALRLDLVIDDLLVNCVEVVSSSPTKALLMMREHEPIDVADHAMARGIGVVSTLQEGIDVLERLEEVLPKRRGRLLRLTDWFGSRPQPPPALEPARPLPSLAIPSSPHSRPASVLAKSGEEPTDV